MAEPLLPGDPPPVAPLGHSWPARRPNYLLAGGLLVFTFFTTTVLGTSYYLGSRTDVISYIPLWLAPETVRTVFAEPELLAIGLRFSLASLFILLCHELGHYLACRYYRLPATLPYFLPAPIGIGTFGAFIRIRGPLRTKRELFDVGVAGPLAGFIALLPFLLIGIARSTPVVVQVAADPSRSSMSLFLPGHGLLQLALIRLLHGPLPPGTVLDPDPLALAAWVGLFATMLNLLPLGQLDGGHILYAVAGRLQRRLAWPLWGALLAVGTFFWKGWFFWCAVTLILGLRHPPVIDEADPLDRRRRLVAWIVLAVFAICFMPVPLAELALAN